MEEQRTINNPNQGSPQEVLSESTMIARGSSGLGVVRINTNKMKKYPPKKNNNFYFCDYCDRVFTSGNALGGHQGIHKQESELRRQYEYEYEMRRKHVLMKPCIPYVDNRLFDQLKIALSNEKHLGISTGPFDSLQGDRSGGVSPSFMSESYSVTPYRSVNRHPHSPHALSLELSLAPPSHPIGSSMNNNNNDIAYRSSTESYRSQGALSITTIPDLNMPLTLPSPPRANLSNNENVSGSSYLEMLISKGKTKSGIFEDDDNTKRF
ncbi:unnamed protein product [Microthlaspi erraticum]|uniref:C2H2-type domain-containing protein n=1 Tax=Microthlaspi erraticum TaxID=1685480 RepID=A0A6D2KBF9_9BRAS|nr:unnamed protein product [Microthlaspi erraticum]